MSNNKQNICFPEGSCSFLDEGRVIFAGGRNTANVVREKIQIYDLAADEWIFEEASSPDWTIPEAGLYLNRMLITKQDLVYSFAGRFKTG